MCTLTLIAEDNAYRLAMNRDETVARGAGSAPKIHQFDGIQAISPDDGFGGTWIGVNEYGISLALLNWNEPSPRVNMEFQSRGQVIPALIHAQSMQELLAASDVLNLERMRPFRMVGVFPAEPAIRELRWNSQHLEIVAHRWEAQHWFSSGLSDEQAKRLRSASCGSAEKEADAGSSAWLRRLHASHDGGPAFGLCVHRAEVQTLSYTEIACSPQRVVMQHFLGNPCVMQPSLSLAFVRLPMLISTSAPVPASRLRLGPIT
jgi:hypothetical protein